MVMDAAATGRLPERLSRRQIDGRQFRQRGASGPGRGERCREEISNLIREHHCEVLAFDLTGVKLVPSGMLGMLASLGRLGVEVNLFNPSDEIRDVLEITRLNSILQIHSVEV
jgi:anti-anti-sigma factor